MSKLVDKERLERLAAGLDARMKTAVKAEEDRAKLAEQGLQNAIDAINNGESGILASAKAYADEKDAAMKEVLDEEDQRLDQAIKDEASRADAAEKVNAQAISTEASRAKAEEADIRADFAAADTALDTKLSKAVSDEQSRAEGVEAGHNTRIGALETFKANQETKNGELDNAIDANAQNIAKEIKDRQDADSALDARLVLVEGSIGEGGNIEKRIDDAEARLDVIQGEGEGSIKKAVADLVDGAPEAANTLKELADSIKDNKDIYDAYVAEHAQAMAQQKADLQKEIDDDVKVVADELAKQKDAAQEGSLAAKIAANAADIEAHETSVTNAMNAETARVNKKIADDIAAESALRVAEEQRIEKKVDDEANRAKGIEADHETRIAKNEAFVAAQPAIDEAQDGRLEALEAKFEGTNSVDAKINKVANDLAAHVTAANSKNDSQDQAIQAAQKAADDAQADVDDVVDRLDSENGLVDRLEAAEGDIDALQTFANAQPGVDSAQNTKIQANTDAIAKEVADRATAITNALKPYSTTEQVKGLLGNVVNSLALTMEGNKMMLKLGGVDGITIHETSLDMATDDDIDAIINGLK
jgi:hypothetical protein